MASVVVAVVVVLLLPVVLAMATRRREEAGPVSRMKPIRRDLRLATRLAGVSNSPTFFCLRPRVRK